MWKFTLLPGVVRCTAAGAATRKGKRARPSLLAGGGALHLLGDFLHLLALSLGRQIDRFLGRQLGGTAVAGGRRRLHQEQVGLGVVGLGGDRADGLLRLRRLVQAAGAEDRVGEAREVRARLAVLGLDVAVPVGARGAQLVLGVVGKR